MRPVARDGGWTDYRPAPGRRAAADADELIRILDTIETPIVVLHRDCTIACFNDAAARATGLTPPDVGRSPRDVTALTGLPSLEEWCADVIATGLPCRHDFHHANRSFVLRIAQNRGSDGQISGTVLTLNDVTAFRVSLDQAISEREFTKTILNVVADPLVVLGADLRMQSANRAFFTMFGISREEMQGRLVYGLANGAFDRPQLRTQLEEIAEGQAFRPVEFDCELPPSGQRSLVLELFPLSSPRRAGRTLLLAVHDVTERKQAEAANARLAAIVGTSDDAIISKDLNGVITSWNKGAERLFGYTAEEAIGKPIKILIPPNLYDEEERIIEEIRRGRRVETYETLRRRKHGSTVEVSLTVSPLRNAQGKVIGASKIARDITQRKHVEAELKQLNEVLESRVEERTRALRAEMDEREKVEAVLQQAQKMDAVGRLTGGVAHDFNNVLATILGSVELALEVLADPVAIRRLLGAAREATERGAKLTDQLLSFARKQVLHQEPSDLNRLVISFQDFIARAIGPTIEVRLALADDPWIVSADGGQFEMALLNLAVNARDAMPEGGTLIIDSANVGAGSADLPRDLAPGDYVSIGVRDSGTGMSADIAAQVFEPFFTTKEFGKGTGLGLSQVYGFCKQLGGTATVSSELGVGTCVRLFLPRAPHSAAAVTARPLPVVARAPRARPGGRPALVIDDEDAVRNFMAEALRGRGFDVTAVKTARRGLEILSGGAPVVDLTVIDFAMPGMNGAEFIRRARLAQPDLPCLLISGYPDLSKINDMPSSGVSTLRKPFRLQELASAIDMLLAAPAGVS
jgi:PAS domain S-box-containing protein